MTDFCSCAFCRWDEEERRVATAVMQALASSKHATTVEVRKRPGFTCAVTTVQKRVRLESRKL